MNDDLTDLLHNWPYEPGRVNARIVDGRDGRPRLQVRLELGVLQMELEGRPDGARPEDRPSLVDHHLERRRWYVEQTGSDVGYVITTAECRALREEAVQYYHRYVAFFALGDYAGVVRDTIHNLDLFDLCRDCGETPEDRTMLEQFRASVIMMRTRAEAELAIADREPRQALAAIDQGLEEIRAVFEEGRRADDFDRANEVQLLRGMRDALVPKLPSSQRAELQERLQAALDAENYELAAILRDELRLLES